MLEMKITITAPDLSEAINNLARAIGLAVTNPVGMTIGVIPTNTTCAAAERSTPPAEAQASPAEVYTPPAPTVPVSGASSSAAAISPAPIVPTAAPQYTLEMIANAGTALIDAGKLDEVSALLAKHGVDVLTALDPACYGSFAAELRALGAAI